jgi:hypothetical protein
VIVRRRLDSENKINRNGERSGKPRVGSGGWSQLQTSELLTDVHPAGVGLNFRPEMAPQVIKRFVDGWEAIRDSLAALEMGHPSPRVRDLTAEVSAGIRASSTGSSG